MKFGRDKVPFQSTNTPQLGSTLSTPGFYNFTQIYFLFSHPHSQLLFETNHIFSNSVSRYPQETSRVWLFKSLWWWKIIKIQKYVKCHHKSNCVVVHSITIGHICKQLVWLWYTAGLKEALAYTDGCTTTVTHHFKIKYPKKQWWRIHKNQNFRWWRIHLH